MAQQIHQWHRAARGTRGRFLFSLLLALSFTLVAFEWRSADHRSKYYEPPPLDDLPLEPIFVVKIIEPKPVAPIAKRRSKPTLGPLIAAKEVPKEEVVSDDPIQEDPIGPSEVSDPITPVGSGAPIEMTPPIMNPEIRPHFVECIAARNNDTDECTGTRIHEHLSRKLKIPFKVRSSVATTVTFEVTKEGSIGSIHCAPKVEREVQQEIERVLRSLPRFIPGSQGGHPVAVYHQIALSMRQE